MWLTNNNFATKEEDQKEVGKLQARLRKSANSIYER